jgi:hypothetical protein
MACAKPEAIVSLAVCFIRDVVLIGYEETVDEVGTIGTATADRPHGFCIEVVANDQVIDV